jgi:ribosome-binding protein aMBF1 (putative translation factor)
MALDRIQHVLELGRADLIRSSGIQPGTDVSAIVTPAQLRAARALIAWSQFKLAREAKVDLLLVRLYEQSRGSYRAKVLRMLRTALESAGVIFVEENGVAPSL